MLEATAREDQEAPALQFAEMELAEESRQEQIRSLMAGAGPDSYGVCADLVDTEAEREGLTWRCEFEGWGREDGEQYAAMVRKERRLRVTLARKRSVRVRSFGRTRRSTVTRGRRVARSAAPRLCGAMTGSDPPPSSPEDG